MLAHQFEVQTKKKRKRIGRGGKTGTYCGRGGKGQSARKGYSQRATFEGGSTSIVAFSKKKRGFNVPEKKTQLVSIGQLNNKFSAGEVVDLQSLKERKLISSLNFSVKILSDGEIDKKIIVKEIAISKTAVEKIEKAGGTVQKKEMGTSAKKKNEPEK